MLEIRLAWLPDVIHRTFAPIGVLDRWVAATPENKLALQQQLEIALELYGATSHWIEERERPSNA